MSLEIENRASISQKSSALFSISSMFRNVRQTSSDAVVVQDHQKIVETHCPTYDIATVLKAVISLALSFFTRLRVDGHTVLIAVIGTL